MHLFDEDKLKAVAYYRHSAEDKQENSVANQREQVEYFANKEEVQVVEHFKDEGISGLTPNRPGFQAMFDKYVFDPNAPHLDYILVYDASRFGRFQKMPEVWRLLGLCEERGIKLASVTRGLPRNDNSVMDSFILTLDFGMSGEYSKLLSEKVSYGSAKIASQGYSAGGTAPYGYVRILLDEQRNRKQILEHGVHKEVSNQRVSFEPATNGDAEVVKRIFREFVEQNQFADEIAEGLNDDGIPTAKNRDWNSSGILRILTNETYMGTRVYGKTWGRLKEPKRPVPSHKWVRCADAHQALIDADTFHKAQERLYWLRPRVRNRNAAQIRKAEQYVWRYVKQATQEQNDDQKFYIQRHLPIVFGATYKRNEDRRTCFYVPTEYKRYEEIIGCEVDPKADGDINLENIYRIKVDDLGASNYHIVSSDDENQVLQTEELEDTVGQLASRVIVVHAPWLTA